MHRHRAFTDSFAQECIPRYFCNWHYHWLLGVEIQPDGSAFLSCEHEDTGHVFNVFCPRSSFRHLAPYQELLQAWLDDPICNEQPLVPVTVSIGTPCFSEAGAHYDYRDTPMPLEWGEMLATASRCADQILNAVQIPKLWSFDPDR
jgi:hypothetical protein